MEILGLFDATTIRSKLDDKTKIVGFEMPKLESDLSYTRIDEEQEKRLKSSLPMKMLKSRERQ